MGVDSTEQWFAGKRFLSETSHQYKGNEGDLLQFKRHGVSYSWKLEQVETRNAARPSTFHRSSDRSVRGLPHSVWDRGLGWWIIIKRIFHVLTHHIISSIMWSQAVFSVSLQLTGSYWLKGELISWKFRFLSRVFCFIFHIYRNRNFLIFNKIVYHYSLRIYNY